MSSTSTAANFRGAVARSPARLCPVFPASDRRTDPASERAYSPARHPEPARCARFTLGIAIFTIGLVKKLVFADTSPGRRQGLPARRQRLRAPDRDLRLLGADLLRFQRLHRHGDRSRHLLGIRLPNNFLRPYGALRSSISGGAGTSPCRSGCATISTFRSAATGAARRGKSATC